MHAAHEPTASMMTRCGACVSLPAQTLPAQEPPCTAHGVRVLPVALTSGRSGRTLRQARGVQHAYRSQKPL